MIVVGYQWLAFVVVGCQWLALVIIGCGWLDNICQFDNYDDHLFKWLFKFRTSHSLDSASYVSVAWEALSRESKVIWWAAYMMQCIYGVLNLWCAASLLCCSFGVMSLLWFIYLLQYFFDALHLRCIASLVLCICTFGMLCIGIFGVLNRWWQLFSQFWLNALFVGQIIS